MTLEERYYHYLIIRDTVIAKGELNVLPLIDKMIDNLEVELEAENDKRRSY